MRIREKSKVLTLMLLITGTWATACKDIVVKVNRKPRDVDLSRLESATSNHDKEQDGDSAFFRDVDYDAIRLIVADAIIRDLHDKGHRNYFRDRVRQFRGQIVEKISGSTVTIPAFYRGSEQCQEAALNYDVEPGMAALGAIMKTGLLSKLQKAETASVNPALADNLEIIKDLIVAELGIKIDGEVHVEKPDGLVITHGELRIQVISDAADSQELKELDKGILKIQFRREYHSASNQNFIAAIAVEDLGQGSGQGSAKAAVLEIKRWTDSAGMLSHEILFRVGAGTPKVDGHTYYDIPNPGYSRRVMIEEIGSDHQKYSMTDIFFPYSPKQGTYKTEIDVKNLKQCKTHVEPMPAPKPAPAPAPAPAPTPAPPPAENHGDSTVINNTVVIIAPPPVEKDKHCNCQSPSQQGVAQQTWKGKGTVEVIVAKEVKQ